MTGMRSLSAWGRKLDETERIDGRLPTLGPDPEPIQAPVSPLR